MRETSPEAATGIGIGPGKARKNSNMGFPGMACRGITFPAARRRAVFSFVMAVLVIGSGPGAAQPPLSRIKLPDGFSISVFHGAVTEARSLAQGPGGTVFVGTRFAGAVWALVDENNDGAADRLYQVAKGLDMPNGVAFRNGSLYVAEATRILRYDNIESRLSSPPSPVEVLAGLPTAPNHEHRWRYIRFGPDGRLHVAVGAPCDICEEDDPYASILRLSADGAAYEVLARGVRNTLGFDWHPTTRQLWFTDNGRNYLGENSPPDELNVLTAAGQHFGFPYCHGSATADPVYGSRRTCSEFQAPAQALGPHVAALGMRFYTKAAFPARYRGQIFIAEHGSWNRKEPIGYRIMLVRLGSNGRPVAYEEFATGWLHDGTAWGRPVDVMVRGDGSLLVSDDLADAVYRIAYSPPTVGPPDSNPPPPGGGNPGGGGGGNPGGGGGGGGGGGSAPNRPPVAAEPIADRELDVGGAVEIDVSDSFRDPEGRALRFEAESSDRRVARVEVAGSVVTLRGRGHGVATVTVTAVDDRGARASQEFEAAVGHLLSFAETALSVPEGGAARLTIAFNRPRGEPTTARYTVGADADPATMDADAADHDGVGGELTLTAGESEAHILIAVHDDDDIEPPEEVFVVALVPPEEREAGFGVGDGTAMVTVAEGVCDRTPQVREALRGFGPCADATAARLARRQALRLEDSGIAALRPLDLSGLSGLRVLDLSGNDLQALPAGMFAGLSGLGEVDLRGNPGAPFELVFDLVRTDALPWAPGPATVVARVAQGAPFEMRGELSVDNGVASVVAATIGAGALESAPFEVSASGPGAVRVSLPEPPPIPDARCGDVEEGPPYPCYQGLATAAGPPLVLFKDPPAVTAAPPEIELSTEGDEARADISGLFAASDGGPLTFSAVSRDPALATARVSGGVLIVASGEGGAEGVATIAVTATDADGLSVTLELRIRIEYVPRGFLRGWRRALPQISERPGEEGPG